MSDYKRLTVKDKEYSYYVQNQLSELDEPSVAVSCYGKIHGTVINHLAELENKIEQGTLIEQKNGKWINLPDYGGGGWKMVGSDEAVQPKHCSICGDVYVKEYKYCPSCGAKMRD